MSDPFEQAPNLWNRTGPNPGSFEALKDGCLCPVIDNGHGDGHLGDGSKYGWWTVDGCPLHSPKPAAVPA